MIARMVNLSLEHGNSNASCLAYVWLGWLLAADFGDYSTALRFAQLSLDLVEKRGLGRLQGPRLPRVSGCASAPGRSTFDLAARSFYERAMKQIKSATSSMLPLPLPCHQEFDRLLASRFTKWNGRQWMASTSRGRPAQVIVLLSSSISST